MYYPTTPLLTALLAAATCVSACTFGRREEVARHIQCGSAESSMTACISTALFEQLTNPRLPVLDALESCLLQGGCDMEEAATTIKILARHFCPIPGYNYLDASHPNKNGAASAAQHQQHQPHTDDDDDAAAPELRKRQKDKTDSAAPTQADDKTTADPKTDAKTTEQDKTTEQPKTSDTPATTDSPQTTDDPETAATTTTAAETSAAAAATTTATAETSAPTVTPVTLSTTTTAPSTSMATTPTGSNAPALVCLTTTKLTTTWCVTATAAGQTGTTCLPTFTPVINCADGLICQSDAAGDTTCMVRQDNLTTSGLIVTIVFGVIAFIFFASFATMIIRSRRTSRRAALALAAANAASGKQRGAGMRDVEASSGAGSFARGRHAAQRSEAHLPLMAAQGQMGAGGGAHSREVSTDYNSMRPAAQRSVSGGLGGYQDVGASRTPSGPPPPQAPMFQRGGVGFEGEAEEDDMGYRRGR